MRWRWWKKSPGRGGTKALDVVDKHWTWWTKALEVVGEKRWTWKKIASRKKRCRFPAPYLPESSYLPRYD